MMSKLARAGGLLLAVLLATTSVTAYATTDKPKTGSPPAATTKAREPARAPAPAGASVGFSITPTPSWVSPVAAYAGTELPSAPVQVLLRDHQTRVGAEATVRYQHAIRLVRESSGLQKAAQLEIDFDPGYQQLQLHRLEIWRNGSRIDKLDRKLVKLLQRETQLERQIVDGRMTASIVVDDLRVGDRLEWAASLVGDNPVFGKRFVDQEWTTSSLGPIGTLQYRLIAPAERQIRYRLAETGTQVSEQTAGRLRETVFRRSLVPQFHYDQLLPAAEHYRDQIELSEFASWAEVADWADGLFKKAVSGSPALTELASRIRAQAADPMQRLQLALDFVQQEVRYFGTENGINSHQPAAADQVLKQRFGDCKDKTALLVRLLADLDIQSTPVLVSVAHREAVKSRLASPLAFDHAIARVQIGDQSLWLDPTRSHQRGSPASRQASGLGYALAAKSGSQDLLAFAPARDELRAETYERFDFPSLAQEGRFESVTVFHGDLAEWMLELRASMPADEFERMLRQEVIRAYPSLQADGAPEFEPVDERNAVRVKQRYAVRDFWRLHERRLLVADFALTTLISPLRLPDPTPRTTGMRLALPGVYLHQLRYDFGDDVASQDYSNRFQDANDQYALQLRYQSGPRMHVVDGELRLLTDSIPAGQWTKYRDQLSKTVPRLASAVSVPVLSPQQATALLQELGELGENVRKGKVKVATQEQSSARARLLVADRILGSGRLAPKLQAQMLIEKAIQLDHLGDSGSARLALDESLRLAPDVAETHEAMAVNALLRRDDEQARAHAAQALKLSPNSVAPRYTRVWANYFSGQFQPAREELLDILRAPGEVERSYGSIWLYLTARQLGEDGLTATRDLTPGTARPAWPFAVLQLLQGQISFDQALAATRENGSANKGRECELYFYAAQQALLDGKQALARDYLRKSLATGVVEFNEFAMAQRELDRLGAR